MMARAGSTRSRIAKGDVFRLVEHLNGVPFVEAMNDVADLVGFVPASRPGSGRTRVADPDLSVPDRWTGAAQAMARIGDLALSAATLARYPTSSLAR
jgi:DNA primase